MGRRRADGLHKTGMSWETRAGTTNVYYTRSRKVRGRIVREYVGTQDSPTARVAAAEDAMRAEARERRRLELASLAEQEAVTALPLETLCAITGALLGATLVATGHHQHAHGEWRRRRG